MRSRFLLGIVGALALSGSCRRTHVYSITVVDAAATIDADTKLPPDAADARLPPDAADTKLPPDAADAKLPPDTAPIEPDAKPPVVCPTTVLKSGDSTLTLQVGSVTRSYVLHVPRAYDGKKPVPLIVDFHGMPSTGQEELTSSTYPAITDSEGVVIAFPEGMTGTLGRGWNFGPCCVAGADDLGFTKALVARLQETACIDPDRIYAVGTLTGSGMVYMLACQAADMFAAVAPAAFDLIEETVSDCLPSRPITVISFRGTADSHVPYNGGPSDLVTNMSITFLGAKRTFDTWRQLDGCTGSPSIEDNSCSRYKNCQGGVEVVLCSKQGGKEEPGDATIAWPTLKRFTR
jgi:polyhydroxybutyrate depolymerase